MAERYEYYNTGDDGTDRVYSQYWQAQTFTPSEGHRITSVKLKLRRIGSPGILFARIRATDENGHPTGDDLCSGSIDSAIISSTAAAWYEITLGAGAELSPDVKYAIVCNTSGGSYNDYIEWSCDNSSPTYEKGWGVVSENFGSTWADRLTRDYMFEEWGEPVGPQIQTQDATSIKSDEAMLHTKVVNDAGKTLSVRHNYGKTTNYGMNTPWQEGKHTNDITSQKITDLDPETEYHFRGEAIFED